MTHWKLTLSYNGASFYGWQVQPELATVQGTLAAALRQITGESVLPQGAGRTDAGVHALAQVASFSLAAPVPGENLHRALNRVLPPEIRAVHLEGMPSDFHARHSARRKTYEYRLFERRAPDEMGPSGPERICSPFLAPFVWDCRWPLHLDRLQAAAAQLLGTQDFSAMAAAARPARENVVEAGAVVRNGLPHPVKTIFYSAWERRDGLLIYRVCGSGFLHHMVRNLVGTMVDIGRGSVELEAFSKILASRDRSQAGPTAPAGGLYLAEVDYESPNRRTEHRVVDAEFLDDAERALSVVGA